MRKYYLLKVYYKDKHRHIKYFFNVKLPDGANVLEEYIDTASDSRRGKALQYILDTLFIVGNPRRKKIKDEYWQAPAETCPLSRKEILFFKIMAKEAHTSMMTRSKFLEQLATLTKSEIESTLIMMKVVNP